MTTVERAELPRLVKLSSFVCYSTNRGTLSEENVLTEDLFVDEHTYAGDKHSRWWGYGFSYVYTKALLKLAPFSPVTFSEDYTFVVDAADRGAECVAYDDHVDDPSVLHVLHNQSSTRTFAPRDVADPTQVDDRFGAQIKRLTGRTPLETHAAHVERQRSRSRRRPDTSSDSDSDSESA